MQEDKRALVMELAYILHRRNLIEVRRRRAKSKINYYETIKQTIKDYKRDVGIVASFTRTLRSRVDIDCDIALTRLEKQLDAAKNKVASYSRHKMKPFKWLSNISGLNKQILKYRAEYMKARYDAARLTCQTRKRVARLTKLLSANINYQFGTSFVESLSLFNNTERVLASEFEPMYREIDANKAIDKVLRGKNEKK